MRTPASAGGRNHQSYPARFAVLEAARERRTLPCALNAVTLFVIATGRQESVRTFVELTAKRLGFEINWKGEGTEEVGIRDDTEEVVIRIDPRYFRPTEVETLLGDPSKAELKLGWSPKTSLEEMVSEMVDHDLETAKQEKIIIERKKSA